MFISELNKKNAPIIKYPRDINAGVLFGSAVHPYLKTQDGGAVGLVSAKYYTCNELNTWSQNPILEIELAIRN